MKRTKLYEENNDKNDIIGGWTILAGVCAVVILLVLLFVR